MDTAFPLNKKQAAMKQISVLCIDLAKNVFY